MLEKDGNVHIKRNFALNSQFSNDILNLVKATKIPDDPSSDSSQDVPEEEFKEAN